MERVLFIDIGLTLLGGPDESPSTYLSRILGLSKEMKSTLSDIVFSEHITKVDVLLRRLECRIPNLQISKEQRMAIHRYWYSQPRMCTPLPGTMEFCDAVLQSGVPYFIVSNLWYPFGQAFDRHLPEFSKHAEHKFFSYEIGARKPSNSFYDHVYANVLQRGICPEHVTMIGDSYANDILPCSIMGSHTVLLSLPGNSRSTSTTTTPNLSVVSSHAECINLLFGE